MADKYMIVKDGNVQFSQQESGLLMLIFEDYEQAKRMAKNNGATVATIGSVEGETLEVHLNAAAALGATPVLVKKDGKAFPYVKA